MNIQKNSLSLENSSKKMISENLIKPKAKIGLNIFLDLIDKWRFDLEKKNLITLNYFKLFLMNLVIQKCLKIKKT